MFRSISSFVATAAIGAMLIPSAAFAHSPSTSGNMVSWSSWKTYGSVSVDKSDYTVTLSEKEGESEYAYQDIGASSYVNEYVTFVSYTNAEDVHSGGNITGLPYLYGYALDKDGKVLSYYQGQNMLHDDNAADGEWMVSHGTFRVPSKAKTIRFFLKQASESGEDKEGDDATFYKPALYFGSTSSSTSSIISSYKNNVDELNDDIPYENGDNDRCGNGRSATTVTVTVPSVVYADDADSNTATEDWTLWAANKTTWNWSQWGEDHAMATDDDSSASGVICAKSGDTLLLNGSYTDGTRYLVYKDSNRYGADYISSITIGGKSYTIFSDWRDVDSGDRACTYASNSSGGYDLSCTIK